MIIRFDSDHHPTRIRLWFIDTDAFMIAAADSAALVLADQPLTAESCADLATALHEASAFLRGHIT